MTTQQSHPSFDSEEEEIRSILEKYRHIAVVGISVKQNRPSYGVSAYMQAAGYDIIPVNTQYAGQTVFGKKIYASLTEAQEAGELIEIVDVFRRAEATPPVAQEAVQVGAKVVWLQLGITNEESEHITKSGGLSFIQDRCIKIEHHLLLKDNAAN